MDGSINYTSYFPPRKLRQNNRYKSRSFFDYTPSYSSNTYEDDEPSGTMTAFWIITAVVVIVIIVAVVCFALRPKPPAWTQTPVIAGTTKGAIGANCGCNADCQPGLMCFQSKCATNNAVLQETRLKAKQITKNSIPPKPTPPNLKQLVKPIQKPTINKESKTTKPALDLPTKRELVVSSPLNQTSAVATADFYG